MKLIVIPGSVNRCVREGNDDAIASALDCWSAKRCHNTGGGKPKGLNSYDIIAGFAGRAWIVLGKISGNFVVLRARAD